MSDKAIEQEIQAKGLTAPRVTPQRIQDVIASKLDKLEPQAAPQQVQPVAAPAGPSQLITHTLHLIGCLMIQLFKVSAYKKAILYLLLHKKVDMTEPSLNGYYS